MNHRERDWLLGRRFVTDFTVVAIDAGDDPDVTLLLYGDAFKMKMSELMTTVERGFVSEHPSKSGDHT